VRWEPDACAAGLISHTGTATLTPTPSASRTTSATTTRSPSLSPSPASFCNIRTVAGTGAQASTGDSGQASSATLNNPHYALVNGTSLLIAEYAGARVRSVDLATGVITTLAGTGSGTGAYLGVAATSANLGGLTSIVLLPGGDLAVAARDRCAVVGINAATTITYAIAGTGTCLGAGAAASSGVAANGTAFGGLRFATLLGEDGLFVSTETEHRVRLVNLTTGAWLGVEGGWLIVHALDPPPPAAAHSAGMVSTWVNAAGTAGSAGDGGAALSATLSLPEGLLVVGGVLLIAERSGHVIRAVDLSTRIITRWAGTGVAGAVTGDGLDKLAAPLNAPLGLAMLPGDGGVLVAQYSLCRVTRITPAGIVRLFIGAGSAASNGDGGSALAANIWGPVSVALAANTSGDGQVAVYISEYDSHKVGVLAGWVGALVSFLPIAVARALLLWPHRIAMAQWRAPCTHPSCCPLPAFVQLQVRAVRWDPGSCTAGLITASATVTTTPTQSASRTASATTTRSPSLSPSPVSVCNIRTVAGTGAASSTGDGGQASSATISYPHHTLVNGTSLLIVEHIGARVRSVDLATGVITTLAGTGSGTGAYLGVAATSANVGVVTSVMTLPGGAVSVASRDRCSFVGVTPHTRVTYAIAGTGTCLSAGQAASSGVAANSTAFGQGRFQALWGVDGLFVTTDLDHRVRLVNLTTGACV
jgi:hypothetical protein